MASTNNGGGVGGGGKEERRRRIAERGSDRMALITGRISTLPPTSPSSTSSPMHHRHAQSVSASAFDSYSDHQNLQPRFNRPHSISSSAFSADYQQDFDGSVEDSKQEASSAASARLKHQEGFKYSKFDNFETKDEKEPQDSDTISRAKDSSINKQQPKKHSWKRHTFFSSRELNFCILATENTRALISVIIALLVVFYYKISNNILCSRPLYMVLLTNITIVIGRIHREKAKVLAESEGDKGEASREGHGWGDAVKLLERGLVAYQAIRGVFIDCSIYLVIVVCAIS